MLNENAALGIAAASFCKAKDIAESPTAPVAWKRPKNHNY